MGICWFFKQARPGDRARESQVEKFFNSDAVINRANAIVREGIQNSLDAAPDDAPVRVRVALGQWSARATDTNWPVYAADFGEHLDAVRAKLSNPPADGEPLRYLVFEDFGTSGLLGDPAQWWLKEDGEKNPFFNYFRAEGISDKEHGDRGRHGVGKFVFAAASRIRSVFGLTRRSDGRQLLMGTTVLRNHIVKGKPYLPDGWFGEPSEEESGLILPVEGDSSFIDRFKRDFGVARRDENGLSVVVPWLNAEVTSVELIKAVVEGYFYPVMRRKLAVEVVDEHGATTIVDHEAILKVTEALGAEFSAQFKPVLDLAQMSLRSEGTLTLAEPPSGGAPKWAPACVPEAVASQIQAKLEAGEMVALRVPMPVRPKGKAAALSHFDIFLTRDASAGDGQIVFIREGIIISDVRPRRTTGIRALVVIDDGPLATFLGDAENPSHTQWQTELVKDKYTYAGLHIEYVVQSVPQILALVSDEQKKPDHSLLIDLFALPGDDVPAKAKRKQRKEGPEPEVEDLDLPIKPRRFVIEKFGSGFAVRPGDAEARRPDTLEIKVAYGVRRGSPFAKYNPADFKLGKGDVQTVVAGGEIVERDDNFIVVHVTEDDFEVVVTGFDTNRDLHVDVKAKDSEVADVAAA